MGSCHSTEKSGQILSGDLWLSLNDLLYNLGLQLGHIVSYCVSSHTGNYSLSLIGELKGHDLLNRLLHDYPLHNFRSRQLYLGNLVLDGCSELSLDLGHFLYEGLGYFTIDFILQPLDTGFYLCAYFSGDEGIQPAQHSGEYHGHLVTGELSFSLESTIWVADD